ncbi:putative nesprin-1 isoform X2 [Apostichopus japonicus]|uniref:Putative nesprin-1 isoform X2 n=1 Tax=Stichopus japonicus TaxID=307972 RepID=A0A2G8K4F9_STIJA|nr:putative nesprin-1 isoform X2 [Apostichopus japonicus]
MEEEPMDVSDRDKTEEAPVTRQIVTDQGPAYTLRKAGQDGVACKDSPDVDYVLSKQTSGAETPNVTGVRAVAKPQPLLVSDPQTGEVFLAEPTEDPEEISQGKIAFVPDDALEDDSIKVYDPEKGQVTEGVPTKEWIALNPSYSVTPEPNLNLFDQIVTNFGPAFILNPVGDNEVPLDWEEFVLSPSNPMSVMYDTGDRKVPDERNVFLHDPRSGKKYK